MNAISAGPIKTLAASGIGDFRFILRWNELNSPLKKNVSQDDIGSSALYLLSDLGSAVTGEVQHVDNGYHTVGMVAVDETEKVSELLGEFNKNLHICDSSILGTASSSQPHTFFLMSNSYRLASNSLSEL